jgi:hypothetical protein
MIETFIKTTLDSVSATSKIVVDTTVKNEKVCETMTSFIDKQNENMKKSVDTACDFGREMYAHVTKRDFYADSAKAMQEASKTFASFFNKN